MKILTRDKFLQLPPGVLFCKGQPWYFEGLAVKEETIFDGDEAIDFFYREICWPESSGDEHTELEDMLQNGTSYPMNKTESRDGCFDPDDHFLIFEDMDLLSLSLNIVAAADLLDEGTAYLSPEERAKLQDIANQAATNRARAKS